LLVPVVFSNRARAAGPGGQSPGLLPFALGVMVAALDFRRCHLRAQRGVFRQSRLCRGDDPVLSPPLRPRGGRPGAGSDRAAGMPKIAAPTVALQGEADGVLPEETSASHAAFFTGPYQHRVLPRIGHNPPQEAPQSFAAAILELLKTT